MEQHRCLFKTNSSLLRDKTSNIKTANEIRAKQRRDLFSSTRNISPSPSPTRQSEQKENLQPTITTKSQKPEAAKPTCTTENEKSSRQKAYLMKYMAWKANKIKEEQAKKEQTKRPVFIPYGSGPANGTRNIKKSFAPKNHTFKPPANLEDLTIDIVGQNKFRCASGNQQMTYNFVPTPKKETIQSRIAAMKLKNSKPISSKPLYLKPVSKPEISKPVVAPPPKPVTNVTKPPSTASKIVPRNTTNGKMTRPPTTQPTVKPSLRSDSKTPAKPFSTIQHVSNTVTKPRIKPPPIQMPAKPLPKKENNIASKLKMPPPSQYNAKNVRRTTATSKVASASSKTVNSQSGLPALKRPNFKASKKVSTSISNAFSTVNAKMNKKKSTDTGSKYLLPNPKTECIASETPSDPNSLNTVFEFVTSTKRKSSSLKNSKVDLLFAAEGNTMSPVDSSAPARPDFIRYSIVQTDAEKTPNEEEEKPMKAADGECSKEEVVTPIKNVIENTTPTIYMSPYVSVSRGKVSTKIEREKRNSVYMGTENAVVPEEVALEHHTMATVRYYQKQLSEEINRLNEQCRVWEEYKEANPQLGDVGGIDMIDVTIGQTKLLINKKLKQFGGLIDRCEEGLRSKKTTSNGDDESFLPVLPEDLDGFWSMVGLQLENVDKRFANIERWKANNWTDPDEVPVKQTNIKKTKKSKPTTTARPNQALQKMLKAAHAAYLKKKAVDDTDNDVILTPSKRQVVIKDRRSRSAAATVITVNTTKVKRISAEKSQVDLNQTPKFTPHHKGFRKSMNLLKSTLLGEQDRKSPADDAISSPNQKSSRKSILKTPGSVRRSKNVIFNSKALKFTIEDTLNDFNSDHEQDSEEDQRTYKLRNRRIILRDSAEFVIPK